MSGLINSVTLDSVSETVSVSEHHFIRSFDVKIRRIPPTLDIFKVKNTETAYTIFGVGVTHMAFVPNDP